MPKTVRVMKNKTVTKIKRLRRCDTKMQVGALE